MRGIDGQLDAITGASGSAVLQMSDVHGDVTVRLPLDTSQPAVAQSYDEYGNAEGDTATAC
ncbi:hypothetical protein [Streptomyces sp. NPDC054783]